MSNIKEAIRQEVDMYIKSFEFNSGIYDSYEAGELNAYKTILAFIDSLPEEKPSEDLEEAAEMAARKIYPYEGGTKGLICENAIPIYKAGFIAGAEWQKEQMMKEAVEFECIGKRVKMTVQELINYYIDTECCDVADECGF